MLETVLSVFLLFTRMRVQILDYHASIVDKSPHLPDEDSKYVNEFWGTPFHALMIGINNYENNKFGELKCYEKKLNIIRHIKEVNPRVNDLHTEPVIKDTVVVNGVVMTKEEF